MSHLSLTAITEILKSNNTPYWRLYMRAGYSKSSPISSFMTEPEKRRKDEDGATENEKDAANVMKESIERLIQQVQFYANTPNVVFSIDYRPAPKSSDIRGPVDFLNDNANTGHAPQMQAQQHPFSGFSGLGNVPDFSSHLESRLEIERERNRIDIERLNFLHDMKREYDKLADEKKKIAEERDKLKELESEYLSDSQRAKNGFNMAIRGLLNDYLPATENKGLAGVESEVSGIPASPQELMIQSIATLIHEQFPDIEDIKVFGVLAQRFANNREVFEAYKLKANTNQL